MNNDELGWIWKEALSSYLVGRTEEHLEAVRCTWRDLNKNIQNRSLERHCYTSPFRLTPCLPLQGRTRSCLGDCEGTAPGVVHMAYRHTAQPTSLHLAYRPTAQPISVHLVLMSQQNATQVHCRFICSVVPIVDSLHCWSATETSRVGRGSDHKTKPPHELLARNAPSTDAKMTLHWGTNTSERLRVFTAFTVRDAVF